MRILLALVCLLLTAAAAGCQRNLIYMPRAYTPGVYAWADEQGLEWEPIHYDLPSGEQTAYYVAPKAAGRPDRLWAVFSGNASFALSWAKFVAEYPDSRSAFILIDYPGYGSNPGRPTRQSIVEAGEAALKAVREQKHLGPVSDRPAVPLGVLGHSMGTAAALELATRSDPDRVVLVSPFTSLLDMARQRVGWPICLMLLDRFDNAARLDELAARSPRPQIAILHGTDDAVIPFAMGRSLADAHPGWIELTPIEGGDHNRILKLNRSAIYGAMMKGEARRLGR